MEWGQLLCSERLCRPDAEIQPGRSPFQQDQDRIVFSAPFRRLAHKTQVHPLAEDDHVHTRLTHSIEVGSVGRSLGLMVGAQISPKLKSPNITSDVFGYIVQAACLAHDIGNPPFGHSGEDAIAHWFKDSGGFDRSGMSEAQQRDFLQFEGNAQGFRILTQLENNRWNGGLQLTLAVLGTFSKYPRSSAGAAEQDNYVGATKFGVFTSELKYFSELADKLGLARRSTDPARWARHPLAFLVEAADDICYAIIDIEDGYNLGYISYARAKDILTPMAKGFVRRRDMNESEEIAKLRAVAIGELVGAVARVFIDHEERLLGGSFNEELISLTDFKEPIRNAKNTAKTHIYWSKRKTEIEIAGNEILSGLLDVLQPIVVALERVDWDASKLSGRAEKLSRLILSGLDGVVDRYTAWQRVTDFVSGMTDRYALHLYRRLKGIAM